MKTPNTSPDVSTAPDQSESDCQQLCPTCPNRSSLSRFVASKVLRQTTKGCETGPVPIVSSVDDAMAIFMGNPRGIARLDQLCGEEYATQNAEPALVEQVS